MYCTKCGVELRSDDAYCSRCGQRTELGRETAAPRSLLLDKRNKKIAGVCAGVARYLDLDPIAVRVIWLALALGAGVGFLVYIAAWIVIPSDAGLERYQPMARMPQPQAGA